MTAYQRILVGLDGSKQSEVALQKAIWVAHRNHARLYLLSVINGPAQGQQPKSSFGFIDRSASEKAIQDIDQLMVDQKQAALDAGVEDVVTKVLRGNAKLEFTTGFVTDEKVDLVVLGASGLNMVGRMIVGSTTAYVVREAPCDVMVVKTDQSNHRLNIEKASYPEM